MAGHTAVSRPASGTILSSRMMADIVLAGLAGLVVWEFFARLIAPVWLGRALDPAALIEMYLGTGGTAALVLRVLTGLVIFPSVYVGVARPVTVWLRPRTGWAALGAAYGVVLWAIAMAAVTSLSGGLPSFWGYSVVGWISLMLIGHVAIGVTLAGVLRLRGTGR